MPHWLIWGVNLTLLALAVTALWRHTGRDAPDARWFTWGLGLKLAGGIALGLFFSGQYLTEPELGGDTHTLHRRALGFSVWAANHLPAYADLLWTGQAPRGAPVPHYALFSNSWFFVRLLTLLHWLTACLYWLNGLWLSLAAFAGSWLLARELARVVPGARLGAYVGALAWPSVVFWLSGVSKDALVLAALGGFTAAALRLTYPPASLPGWLPAARLRWWALLLASGWLFWKIKFFIAAVVFVAFGALAFTEKLRASRLGRRWPWVRAWQLFLVAALALAPLSRVAHRAFRPEYLLLQVPRNQAALRARDAKQPELRLPITPSLGSFARYAPAAALGTFTRPWLWEGRGWKWRALGLENSALLVLAAWAARGWWRRGRPLGVPMLAGALLLIVVVVAVMFGLTTPNLGSLNRYRAVLLPFTLFLLDWLRVGELQAISGKLQAASPSG